MDGGLRGIDMDKRKYDTGMNSCKYPHLFEEARTPSAVRSGASDNTGSECNNDILTYTNEFDDGSVKLSSPSGM